jgi:hypothetical protein
MTTAWNTVTGLGGQFRTAVQNDPWLAVNLLDEVVSYKNAKNSLLFAPLIAYDTARAPEGDRVATFGSGAASLASFPAMAAAANWGLKLIAPTLGGPVGWVVATVGSIALASYGNSWLQGSAHRQLRRLHDRERNQRRLEMGGNFIDTQNASLLRQRAVNDMSSAFGNARSFLGREGAFLHR